MTETVNSNQSDRSYTIARVSRLVGGSGVTPSHGRTPVYLELIPANDSTRLQIPQGQYTVINHSQISGGSYDVIRDTDVSSSSIESRRSVPNTNETNETRDALHRNIKDSDPLPNTAENPGPTNTCNKRWVIAGVVVLLVVIAAVFGIMVWRKVINIQLGPNGHGSDDDDECEDGKLNCEPKPKEYIHISVPSTTSYIGESPSIDCFFMYLPTVQTICINFESTVHRSTNDIYVKEPLHDSHQSKTHSVTVEHDLIPGSKYAQSRVIVRLKNVTCANSGAYKCSIKTYRHGHSGEILLSKETYLYVFSKDINLPVIKSPEYVNAAQTTTVTCSSEVGLAKDGIALGELELLKKKQGADQFQAITDVTLKFVQANCRIKQVLTYVFTPDSSSCAIDLKCLVRPINSSLNVRESKTSLLRIITNESSTTDVPTLIVPHTVNDGDPVRVTCSSMVGLNASGNAIGHLKVYQSQSESDFQQVTIADMETINTDCRIKQTCVYHFTADVSMSESKFKCVVEMENNAFEDIESAVKNMTVVSPLDRAQTPDLSMTYEIIEGRTTPEDRLLRCVGRVDNPPSHLEIYSDISGQMETMLSSLTPNVWHKYGKIVRPVTDGPFHYVNFAFSNLTLENNGARIWCVNIPNQDGATASYSSEGIIKVVPANYCHDATSTYMRHPYTCRDRVWCHPTFSVPKECNNGQCINVDTGACHYCPETSTPQNGCPIT